MKTIQQGLKILNSLLSGHYICFREKEEISEIKELEHFVFYKDADEDKSWQYSIIGCDEGLSASRLLENCKGEFSPLFEIRNIATKDSPNSAVLLPLVAGSKNLGGTQLRNLIKSCRKSTLAQIKKGL